MYNLLIPIRNLPLEQTQLSIMAKSFAQMVTAIGLYGVTGDRKKLVTQEGD